MKKNTFSLNKAKKARTLAKFYGGSALTGSAKQKSWGEEVRKNVLESDALTSEQKETLLQIGGFTFAAKFWIDNKDVEAREFIAEKIVSEYRGLRSIESGKYEILAKTGSVSSKNEARKAIKDYKSSCTFTFPE